MNNDDDGDKVIRISRQDEMNLCFALGGAMGSLFRCNMATGEFARSDWETTRDAIETATNIVMRALGAYTYDVSGRDPVARGAEPPPAIGTIDPYEQVRAGRKARE